MSTMILEPTRVGTRHPQAVPRAMRLTRRGRLGVFLLSLLVMLALGVFVAAGSVATDEPGSPEPTRVVTIGTGDTLWGIASELADDGGTRAMMEEIEELNALESGMLVAGDDLRIPAS